MCDEASGDVVDVYRQKWLPPPGGLEPPTFRLTAERAADCATEADVREGS